jgi:hypothetical protein
VTAAYKHHCPHQCQVHAYNAIARSAPQSSQQPLSYAFNLVPTCTTVHVRNIYFGLTEQEHSTLNGSGTLHWICLDLVLITMVCDVFNTFPEHACTRLWNTVLHFMGTAAAISNAVSFVFTNSLLPEAIIPTRVAFPERGRTSCNSLTFHQPPLSPHLVSGGTCTSWI